MVQSSLLVRRKRASVNDANSLIPALGRDLSLNCLIRCQRSQYDTVSLLNKTFRALIRTGELYKARREAGIVEPWVYFSCNLLEWEAFDPSTNRWIQNIPKMPFEGCFAYSDKESLAVGTDILVFGREVTGPAVYKYSLLDNKWTTSANKLMNTPRCMFASSAVGTTAYVAAGCTHDGDLLNSAEVYNWEKDMWTALPDITTARRACAGAMMDGKFYVVGGTTKEGEGIRSAEVYDPVEKTWEVIPEMFPRVVDPGECPPLVAVVKNEMYFAHPGSREVMRYVKENNAWVNVGKLPERVTTNKGWGVAFRACGERLLVVGGSSISGGGGMLEVNSWVPTAGGGGGGGGGGEQGGGIQWEVIATKTITTFVYNCAVMGC